MKMVQRFGLFSFQSNLVFFRAMLLFTGGLLATFGSTYIDMAGAGPLGCLVLPFVSGIKWRKMNTPEQTVCIASYDKGIINYSVFESTD